MFLVGVFSLTSQPEMRKTENKCQCFKFPCPRLFCRPPTGPEGESRLPDDGACPPLTWEINPLTGGQRGGEGAKSAAHLPAEGETGCFMRLNYRSPPKPSPTSPLIHPATPRCKHEYTDAISHALAFDRLLRSQMSAVGSINTVMRS